MRIEALRRTLTASLTWSADGVSTRSPNDEGGKQWRDSKTRAAAQNAASRLISHPALHLFLFPCALSSELSHPLRSYTFTECNFTVSLSSFFSFHFPKLRLHVVLKITGSSSSEPTLSNPCSRLRMRPSTSSLFKLPPALYILRPMRLWTRTGAATARGAAIRAVLRMAAGRATARTAEADVRRMAVRNMLATWLF